MPSSVVVSRAAVVGFFKGFFASLGFDGFHASILFFCVVFLTATTEAKSRDRCSMNTAQKEVAYRLGSLFRHGDLAYHFEACEYVAGKGLALGHAGLSSCSSSVVDMLKSYVSMTPSSALAPFLHTLQKMMGTDRCDSESGLLEADFCAVWASESLKPDLQQLQWDLVDKLLMQPSEALSSTLALKLALSRAVVFDAALQLYDLGIPDPVTSLVEKTNANLGRQAIDKLVSLEDEFAWLSEFLNVRLQHLGGDVGAASDEGWKSEIARVKVYEYLMHTRQYALSNVVGVFTNDYIVEIQSGHLAPQEQANCPSANTPDPFALHRLRHLRGS
eukprot:CAMPEP_0196661818 /NCGR_PEP_ID=MMETSP1086-20130531/45975_1 /TAXON_ID=77921 /ORGANISM="Cyanoptyche  gloeocystis , Strain SAG4.97" /LENGTH=330 /DNA_ID=CAMNT_0041996899 /DNA_START=14 /DNA_END=1006 /DNA_ORIENTATION=-